MNLIEIKNVSKIYKNGDKRLEVLKNINLNIEKGEMVSIIGESGSGKSTLMNILGCLDTVEYGEYYLNGKNIFKMSQRQLSKVRNEKIGFIFQSFNLISTLTALENVELPLYYRGVKRAKRREIAYKSLCDVGLKDRVTHYPSQLSGGQQQRVAIARAISARPDIVLADEPTGNLDSTSSDEIIKLLFDLNNHGKTVIVITHDNNLADRIGKKIWINDGKIKSF